MVCSVSMKSLLDGEVEWKYNPVFSLCDEGEEGIWNDPSVTLKAKGLFSYMKNKPANWDFSAERIALENADGRKAVLNALNELVGGGYVERRKLGSGRMVYKLSGEPYVGVEPEIVKSRIGEYMDDEEVSDEWCVQSLVDMGMDNSLAIDSVKEWNGLRKEMSLPKVETIWNKWKKLQ